MGDTIVLKSCEPSACYTRVFDQRPALEFRSRPYIHRGRALQYNATDGRPLQSLSCYTSAHLMSLLNRSRPYTFTEAGRYNTVLPTTGRRPLQSFSRYISVHLMMSLLHRPSALNLEPPLTCPRCTMVHNTVPNATIRQQ